MNWRGNLGCKPGNELRRKNCAGSGSVRISSQFPNTRAIWRGRVSFAVCRSWLAIDVSASIILILPRLPTTSTPTTCLCSWRFHTTSSMKHKREMSLDGSMSSNAQNVTADELRSIFARMHPHVPLTAYDDLLAQYMPTPLPIVEESAKVCPK